MCQGVSQLLFPDQPSLCVVSNGAELIVVSKRLFLDRAGDACMRHVRATVSWAFFVVCLVCLFVWGFFVCFWFFAFPSYISGFHHRKLGLLCRLPCLFVCFVYFWDFLRSPAIYLGFTTVSWAFFVVCLVVFCWGFFVVCLLLFFAFPSYISGVHHFWVRFLRI